MGWPGDKPLSGPCPLGCDTGCAVFAFVEDGEESEEIEAALDTCPVPFSAEEASDVLFVAGAGVGRAGPFPKSICCERTET